MDNALVISPRVVERLRFMSPQERRLIFDTLLSDEVLHEERITQLTASQELIYMLVRDMIMRDSHRYSSVCAQKSPIGHSMSTTMQSAAVLVS